MHKMRNLHFLLIASLAVSLKVPAQTDSSPDNVQFVTVEEGVQLGVLDWGGRGRPLIFLAGAGGTAHAFDILLRSLLARIMSTPLRAKALALPASRRGRTGTTQQIAWETMSSLSCKRFGSSVLFWWGTRLRVRS